MNKIICLLILLAVCNSQLNDTINCINAYLQTYKDKMNPTLFKIFVNAFPNTIKTTVQHYSLDKDNQSTYIITGDIQAMWLRDSTNQFIPYIRMPQNCIHIMSLAKGILNTQAQFIMTDGYSNAFKKFEKSKLIRPSYLNDISQTLIMGVPVDLIRKREFATPSIWERKWQIDSLAAFLRLAYEHYQRFQKDQIFTLNFFKALTKILSIIEQQTKDTAYEKKLGKQFYTFYRSNQQLPSGSIKQAYYTGMVKTGFRPSDSPNQLPYNIPGNAMISTFLNLVADKVLSKVPSNSIFKQRSIFLAKKMNEYSASIKQGIYKYGIISQSGKQIFAYQVDGRGNYRLYDDSNLPCLLSLPYLSFLNDTDPIYLNTRKFILSQKNKYFYSRGQISGVGSSHTDQRYIWPLALTIQILTSKSNFQIKNCLETLIKSAKNDLMHESFSIDDPTKITRQWFAWANSFFGEMIMHLAQTNPQVLK